MSNIIKERKFKNENLRIEALTHKSYAFENPMTGNHNERLEFLGDAIISFVVADYLYNKFENYNEGQLTILRSKLVCRETLSQFALKVGLNNHLRLGMGATNLNARNNEKVLEDAFEAYIGALFLDSDKNYGEIMKFMEPLLSLEVKKIIEDITLSTLSNNSITSLGPINEPVGLLPCEDPIGRLQIWSQKRGLGLPQYEEVEKTGSNHNPQFTFKVNINGKYYGEGTAKSKKEAKKQAATGILSRLY